MSAMETGRSIDARSAEEPIPIIGPWITEKEVEYVAEACREGWYSNATLYPTRFEEAFGEYVGRRNAIAMPSCTSSIHLALLAAGVGPGDEVIATETTWIGSAAPITYVGASPVFADIERRSWCIDAESVRRNVTPRTKAVVIVDLYGVMPDMDAIADVAREHGLVVIEDAAQAVGAMFKGRRAGSFGDFSAFSFHGTKALTTGEGGMLLTDDDDLAARCRWLGDQAHERGTFWNMEVAYKYKMSSLQAALGLAQLERVGELLERKAEIFGWYRDRLGDMPHLSLNPEPEDVSPSYWMVTVVPDPELGVRKEPLIATMRERGIAVRPFFYPLSSLPAYAGDPTREGYADRNPVAYEMSVGGVNLPSGYDMTEAKVDRVCRSFLDAIATSAG